MTREIWHAPGDLVFAHGIAGYARLLLPFLVPLRERGINIVAPDLQGYGYSEGPRGDFCWNDHVRNLGDAVAYARARFSGKVLLGGGSLGVPLGLRCGCPLRRRGRARLLVSVGPTDREYIALETRLGRLTFVAMPLFRLLGEPFGGTFIKTYRIVSYDTLSASPELNALVKRDPQAGTRITLRGAASLAAQSTPDVAFEDWRLPTLVLQPGADRMTPARYARRVRNARLEGQEVCRA